MNKIIKILVGIFIFVLILGLFALALWKTMDKEVPNMTLNSGVEIDYQSEITEEQLLEKLVKDVSDDKTAEEDINVYIKNFDELDTNKLGTASMSVIAEDETGREVLISEDVEVRKNAEQLLTETKEQYKTQVNELKEQGLFNDSAVTSHNQAIDELTVDNYQDYQATLDKDKADATKDVYEKNQNLIKKIKKNFDKLEDVKVSTTKYEEQLGEIYQAGDDTDKVLKANEQLTDLNKTLNEEVEKQEKLAEQTADEADDKDSDDKDSDDKDSDDKDE